MKSSLLVVLALTACTSGSKHEASMPFVLPPPIAEASFDVARGTKLAQQGNTNGAAACVACHGANGEGMEAGGFPRLAGQPRYYLESQLRAYQSGARDNPVMIPIAKGLNDQELQDVAAYFDSLAKIPYARTKSLGGAQLKRALQLTTYGDQKLGLQSCQNCHGPGGIGEGPSIPYLKGQWASYITAQLQAWKNGSRKTNPEHMGYISKLLKDDDVAAVAAYYQQVPNGENK